MNSYNDKEEKIQEMIKDLIRRGGISYQLIVGRFESKILNLKNPKLSYWFALNINGANVRAHGQAIINSGDPEWNYKFAKDIKGSDVNAHGQAIINSGDLKWNYEFAKDIKGSDVRAHGRVIINSGDIRWNCNFAADINGADIRAHGKVMKEKSSLDNFCNVMKYREVKWYDQESELELLDNYLDVVMASEEKDASKIMTK